MENSVKLVELFTSFQGEGPDTGKRCLILRFKECNRNCPWCDTKAKMVDSEETIYNLNEIQRVVSGEKSGLLITGGEPTFSNNFQQTLTLLNELKYPFANVESNGYQLAELVKTVSVVKRSGIRFMYSPKIFTPDDLAEAIGKTNYLATQSDVFVKLVYDKTKTELLHVYLDHINKIKLNNRVYLMPQGTSRDELLRDTRGVLNAAERFKVNFSSREHIIYGFV